jgi:inosose dehydratase
MPQVAISLRIGNAPLSYGAFELTVGRFPNVPEPDDLLAAMAAAGYEGTELGPPGFLGEGDELRERLERHGLALTGGWCPFRFSESEHWEEDLSELSRTLDLFEAGGGSEPRPVFGDGGSPARRANPGRGAEDSSLGLDAAGWNRWAEGVERAASLARSRGFEPVLHPHAATNVEAPWEIERALELTDLGLAVDPGHLLIGGADPVQVLRTWADRVAYVHAKDARLGVVREAIADHADMLEAWRRGIFCQLGAGDVDLDTFFDELQRIAYSGWIVVEQDRIPRPDEQLSESIEAQIANREWLRENLGV